MLVRLLPASFHCCFHRKRLLLLPEMKRSVIRERAPLPRPPPPRPTSHVRIVPGSDRLEYVFGSGRIVTLDMPDDWRGSGCASSGCCRSQGRTFSAAGVPICCQRCFVSGGQRHTRECDDEQTALEAAAQEAVDQGMGIVQMATEVLMARGGTRGLRQPGNDDTALLRDAYLEPNCSACRRETRDCMATHVCLWCQDMRCPQHIDEIPRLVGIGRWSGGLCVRGTWSGNGPRGYCREALPQPAIFQLRDHSRSPRRPQSGDRDRADPGGSARSSGVAASSGGVGLARRCAGTPMTGAQQLTETSDASDILPT